MKFPSKDLKETKRINEILLEDSSSHSEVVHETLDTYNWIKKDYDLIHILGHLETKFQEWSIVNRILNNDIKDMTNGLCTSARFGYLTYVVGGESYSGGYDCMHIYSLLKSCSVNDHFAIQKTLKNLMGPFKKGHQSTVLLCNGIYIALGALPVDDKVMNKLASRKESTYFRALYDCIIGIISNDLDQFITSLLQVIKFNKRQTNHNSLEKMISIHAHALKNIFVSRNGDFELKSIESFKLPWDSEFDQFVSNNNSRPYELGHINTCLNSWVNQLPTTLRIKDLNI